MTPLFPRKSPPQQGNPAERLPYRLGSLALDSDRDAQNQP